MPVPVKTLDRNLRADSGTARRLRSRAVQNVLRMGHCAPTVVQTLLDISRTADPPLTKMAAGLPGGIGNTGAECGGITGSLLLIGRRYARDPLYEGVPVAVYKGRDLVHRFVDRKGTVLCRQILGHHRVPFRCVGVVRDAPCMCAQALCSDCAGAIAGESRDACRRLFAHYKHEKFHCAHAVFDHLRHAIPVTQELLDATSPFAAGTAFMGLTCSSFTAGVIAMGAALGQIENSRRRVLRMLAIMIAGGNAFADDLNAFNRIMNLGHRLSQWFTAEFGSTQCRAITNCDFSTLAGVEHYVASNGVARCRAIADRVGEKVCEMLEAGSS